MQSDVQAQLQTPAVEIPAAAPTRTEALERIQRQIAAGSLEDARIALAAMAGGGDSDSQTLFLLGLTELALKHYDPAIARFRAILAREPAAGRVRLELARAFYEKRDYRNAERQFQLARAAAALPPVVRRKIDSYLIAIRQQRRLTFDVSLKLAPDSNINSATTASTIPIYGLPFELAADARSTSGVGVEADFQASWAQPLSGRLRWDFVAGTSLRRYGDARFNDTTVALASGPRLITDRFIASLQGTWSRRWFGGAVFARQAGAALAATWYLSGRTGMEGRVEGGRLTYPAFDRQSGRYVALTGGLFHAPGPTSLARLSGSYGRQFARDPIFASRSFGISGDYQRELGAGFSVSASTALRHSRYDAAAPELGGKRRDWLAIAQLGVLNRRISHAGFTPTVSLTYTDNNSNLALHSYTRTRVEMGITRTF